MNEPSAARRNPVGFYPSISSTMKPGKKPDLRPPVETDQHRRALDPPLQGEFGRLDLVEPGSRWSSTKTSSPAAAAMDGRSSPPAVHPPSGYGAERPILSLRFTSLALRFSRNNLPPENPTWFGSGFLYFPAASVSLRRVRLDRTFRSMSGFDPA